MITSERGVIYVVSGRQFVDEACASATSLKRHMPELPVLLYTPEHVDHPAIDCVLTDHVSENPDDAKAHKIECMANSPFKRTLFLDSDTRVMGRVDELFEVLDAFALGVAHAPNRLYFGDGQYPSDKEYPSNIPGCFPEMNTGVIVYNSESAAVHALFRAWRELYEEMKGIGAVRDQISFREVLYDSDVRMMVLPPEYNCRSEFPVYLDGAVKINHARHTDSALAEQVLTKTKLRRTLHPWMFEKEPASRLRGFYRHLREQVHVLLLPWITP